MILRTGISLIPLHCHPEYWWGHSHWCPHQPKYWWGYIPGIPSGVDAYDQGAKVNGQYYRNVLLHQQLLPTIRDLSGNFFIFQQDNAPAHRARENVQLLTYKTPVFIAPALWPAKSPDLNPVDCQTWERHRSRMHDVDQLKSRLIEEREHFHRVFIDEAITQWRTRLRVCIRAHGGYFEHRL